jgi:hypothetical protein
LNEIKKHGPAENSERKPIGNDLFVKAGPWENAVYEIPKKKHTMFHGCFNDDPNNRRLAFAIDEGAQNFTFEQCRNKAEEKFGNGTFFALQNGLDGMKAQCWIGNPQSHKYRDVTKLGHV